MKKHYFEDEIFNFDSEEENKVTPMPDSSKRDRYVLSEKTKSGIIKYTLIVLIVYVAFLIIGALSTEYYYDSNGNRKIVKADITVHEDRDDYDTLEKYISQVRDMIVDITIIDIKLANGDMSYGQAAIQYSEVLKTADILIPKIETADIETRNALIKQNLQIIVSNDIALYLQFMIKGLEQQDNSNINDAALWKTSMMQTYNSINDEMLELAKRIYREDSDFFSWGLEKAVSEKDKTAILNERDETE